MDVVTVLDIKQSSTFYSCKASSYNHKNEGIIAQFRY